METKTLYPEAADEVLVLWIDGAKPQALEGLAKAFPGAKRIVTLPPGTDIWSTNMSRLMEALHFTRRNGGWYILCNHCGEPAVGRFDLDPRGAHNNQDLCANHASCWPKQMMECVDVYDEEFSR